MPVRSLLLLCVVVSACGASTGTPIPDPSLDGEKTWYGVVGPLVQTRCAICHRADDIGPFPLETFEQVKRMAPAMTLAVQEKRMPPFPPDQTDESGCPRLDDVRRMSAEERTVLLDWLAAGQPEGTVRELPATPKNAPLGDPSDTWKMSEPYTGTGIDDYRCFVVQPTLFASIPVAAVSVRPDNRSIVHHASVYLVGPSELSQVRALDDADPGVGYKCFGGVGVTPAYPTGLWVPGNDAPLVPPNGGVGFYLVPGWAFVVQIHYNYKAGAQPDQSSVVLWRANAIITEVPHLLVAGNMSFTIPPNAMGFQAEGNSDFTDDATAVSATTTPEGQIYSVWAHQHLLGKSFAMDLVRPDGSEQCLLRIPKWNFSWQSIYKLKTFVNAKPGDKLRVRCDWDNPNASQVSYGEGTADEMCFGSVALLKP